MMMMMMVMVVAERNAKDPAESKKPKMVVKTENINREIVEERKRGGEAEREREKKRTHIRV